MYSITCTVNGKVYIGSSSRGCVDRWAHHRKQLRNNTHHSVLLQRAWNKHGEQCFIFAVLEETSAESAIEREQCYIDKLQSANPKYGYNILPLAASCRGVKRSAEVRARLSQAQRRRAPPTDETRKRMSEAQRGKKMKPEAIEKTRQAHLGKKYSYEQRRRNSERNMGKKLSPEHLSKLIAANTGRTVSEETRLKISMANKGKKRSEDIKRQMTGVKRSDESRKRMAESQRGKKQSPETIAKRIESLKRTVMLRHAVHHEQIKELS